MFDIVAALLMQQSLVARIRLADAPFDVTAACRKVWANLAYVLQAPVFGIQHKVTTNSRQHDE